VASRQQEKEQRRKERIAREEAERRRAARRRRLQYVVGGLLAAALVAGVVALGALGLGGGGDDSSEPSEPSEAAATVELPTQQTGELRAAARTAGCKVTHPEIEGATHETKQFAPSDYRTNPPTSGNHNPDWYEDGIYAPGGTPELGKLVHTLEHGRIDVQYKPGTPEADVAKLEALLAESERGYHMLLFENTTGMDAAVAATAWGHSVTCPRMSDDVFDVLRTFRSSYIDKGPEAVP
jgi:hypothetical protein